MHKCGSKPDCDNYRPIFVISTIDKLFQKLTLEHFISYLDENNIKTLFSHVTKVILIR